MGDRTGINWTDATWNPVRGCTKVSPGCKHCYAETMAGRFCGPGQPYEGLAVRRLKVISDDDQRMEARWTGEVRFVAEHLADPLRWRKPRKVFANSMSDLFHESLTNEQIAAVFGVMAAAPQHTFQVLTKRARRMREWFEWIGHKNLDDLQGYAYRAVPETDHAGSMAVARGRGKGWPLPNVWLGVPVENQDAADERIPELLRTPAALRFLNCEPLLGPLDLRHCLGRLPSNAADFSGVPGVRDGIDWVIAGCESGNGARPCDVTWLRSLRDQCADAEVPFFLKQAKPIDMGTARIGGMSIPLSDPLIAAGPGSKRKPGGIIELPYLDGVRHAAFPAVRS